MSSIIIFCTMFHQRLRISLVPGFYLSRVGYPYDLGSPNFDDTILTYGTASMRSVLWGDAFQGKQHRYAQIGWRFAGIRRTRRIEKVD